MITCILFVTDETKFSNVKRSNFTRLLEYVLQTFRYIGSCESDATLKHYVMCTKNLPYFLSGLVVTGFGRGSKALGIPTANLEDKVVETLPNDFNTGIYYGWSSIDGQVYKMVASIGWNPFYKNEKKTVEVHLLHKFENDFYGKLIKVIFTGYIRPEKDFTSEEELIKEINHDIEVAEEHLEQPKMSIYKDNKFLTE